MTAVALEPVGAANWRDCAALEVTDEQQDFVAPVTRYLALCAYDEGPWTPWAARQEGRVVGFVMTGLDPADDSMWIGGLVVDAGSQGRGIGRGVVDAIVRRARDEGRSSVALSVSPRNSRARDLYLACGFVDTGELEDDEAVLRLALP
jgi:diamine N-acetyltransferase